MGDLIEPGSVLLTDAWPGYDLVEQHGYVRKATNLAGQKQQAHEVHPGVHRVVSRDRLVAQLACSSGG